jgi:hypothetical protein
VISKADEFDQLETAKFIKTSNLNVLNIRKRTKPKDRPDTDLYGF